MNNLNRVEQNNIIEIDSDAKTVKLYHAPTTKPIITYWRYGDPTQKLNILEQRIEKNTPNINIVRTRNITDDFIKFCLKYQKTVFLHVYISGLNATIFEPNIPPVKHIFFGLKKLIDSGFNQNQILVVIDPILPNDNGKKILELILRCFTEFKELRLRFIRFQKLSYYLGKNNKETIRNDNVTTRQEFKKIESYVKKIDTFNSDYYKLIEKYRPIISIDTGEESLIGIRELRAFGLRNEWVDNGVKHKIIEYEKGNRYKPIVINISGSAIRCKNRCLLCPYHG